jgi:hypothetical protein
MQLQQSIDARIAELRHAAGLPKRKASQYKVDSSSGVEYVANPESAEITEMKTERGFVYFNLNGGDSWAYYHPVEKPYYIFNFKGEPVYRTQDLLPSYWAELAKIIKEGKPDSSGMITLAFRDFATDTYYNGTYNTKTKALDLSKAGSKEKLKDFLKDNGKPIIDAVPDWDLVFDPEMTDVIDCDKKILNTYRASDFLLREPDPTVTRPPALIDRIALHAVGGDPVILDAFYNWTACIVQHKTTTLTAWILHGTQGTGKGVLFNHILRPILGTDNTAMMRAEELSTEFTGRFDNKFLVFIDEIQAEESTQFQRVVARLKSMITEPTISIRNMYAEARERANHCNFIFASNMPQPMVISEGDRRFNVAAYQHEKIQLSFEEIDSIKDQLFEFYSFLCNYPADRVRARTVIHTADRERVISLGVQSAEDVSRKLTEGNLAYFVEGVSHSASAKRKYEADDYHRIVKEIVETLPPALTRDELQTIFTWLCGKNVPDAPYKFATYLRHKGIELEPVHIPARGNFKGGTKRAMKINWVYDQQWLDDVKQDIINGDF